MKYKPPKSMINNFETVFKTVSELYGVSVQNMRGKRRPHHIVEPRFVAIHLAKMTGRKVTWPLVGWYANRDHSSCVYADDKVMAWKDTDKRFKQKLERAAQEVAAVL